MHCLSIVQSIGLFAHYINRPIQYTHTRRLKTDTFGYSSQVLFLYAHVDEFVMQHVRSHRGKQLCSAEAAEFDELGDDSKEEEKDASSIGAKDGTALSAPVMQTLCDWFATEALAGKVTGVSTSSKLTATPALLTGHEPEAMRRYRAMLTMMADENTSAEHNELQNACALELNP